MKSALMTRRVMVLWALLAFLSLVLLIFARFYPKPTSKTHLDKQGMDAVNGIAQYIRPLDNQQPEITNQAFAQALLRHRLSERKQKDSDRAFKRLNTRLKALYDSGWLGKQYWFHGQAWLTELPHEQFGPGIAMLRRMDSIGFLKKLEWKERTHHSQQEKRFASGNYVMAAETLLSIPNP